MRANPNELVRRKLFRTPPHLARNQAVIDAAGLERIERSIRANYHTGWRAEENYSSAAYAADLRAHLSDRLEVDRNRIVPWLDSARPLQDLRILEVGCGTGSSTVALAEQGATVTGIDVDEGGLAVARDRCAAYDLNVSFRAMNADTLPEAFDAGSFDLVVFYACLEHMTITERLVSLRQAWELLPPGALLAIVETPNRLWHFDHHTSHLPFFFWLPDELAFRYARFSSRENFRERYVELTADALMDFARRGRGMSFHELDLAIGPSTSLEVVSSLSTHERLRSVLRSRLDRRFRAVLRTAHPGLHPGFYDPTLYLVIRKT